MDAYDVDAETTVYIAMEETLIGSKGPFHPVHADPEVTQPWGYYCSACDTVDNAVDTMGRFVGPARRISA